MLFLAIDLTILSFPADDVCKVSTIITIESITHHLVYVAVTIFVGVVCIMFIAPYMELSEKSIEEEVQARKFSTAATATDHSDVIYFDIGPNAEFASSIDISKCALLSIIGLPISSKSEEEKYSNRSWSLVPFSPNSHIFTCRSCSDGIILRTSIFVKRSAKAVLYWLLSQNITTGLEDVSDKHSTILESHKGGSISLKRICFKGSITSARRDFIVITSISVLCNGTYVISSRSVHAPESSLLSCRKSKNGFVRGIIYASGFVLRPIESSDGDGCEVFFGAHLDMLGVRPRPSVSLNSTPYSSVNPRTEARYASANISKLDDLTVSVGNLMERIQMISVNEADSGDNSTGGNFNDSNIVIPVLRESIDSSNSFDGSACSCFTTPSHQNQNTTSPPASLRKIILSDPPNIISSNYTRNIQNNNIIISNTRIDDNICDTSQPVISHRISSPSPSTVVVPSNLHHYSIQNPDTMNVIPNNMNVAPNNMNAISNNKNMKQINLSIKPKVAKEKINNDFVWSSDVNY